MIKFGFKLSCIKLLKFFIFLVVFCACVFFAGRAAVIFYASLKADELIQKAGSNFESLSADDQVLALAGIIFSHFDHVDPAHVPVLRLRPFLTNHRLPAFIRLPDGVIETIVHKGYCDNAARMLKFTLGRKNYASNQWNMISSRMAHSALLVDIDENRHVLVDPFYGYVLRGSDQMLLNPFVAQRKIQDGVKLEDVFFPLGDSSDITFYKEFSQMYMAAQGDDLVLVSKIPKLKGGSLQIGKIDGKEIDVKGGGASYGMTPFWHYMGHKYNREWVRVLEATEPVRVTMTLVSVPTKNILVSEPSPEIQGNNLVWSLDKGNKIYFYDGRAMPSLKTMNSYLGVDRILFEVRP